MMRIYHHSRIALLWSFLLVCPGVLAGKDQAGTAGRKLLDGNLQVVDLSDLDKALPLDVVSTTQILRQTEAWEHSTWKNPNWPAGGGDSVGFPSLVKNDRGPNPDANGQSGGARLSCPKQKPRRSGPYLQPVGRLE